MLGEKHPDTIRSMINLEAIYHTQKRYNEAEKLKEQVLDLQLEVLGEKHPDIITSIADLAAIYYTQS